MGLITVEEYQLAAGSSEEDEEKIQQAIDWASDVIKVYTDRDFGEEAHEETRTYLYEGYGYCEIDDCTNITNVSGAGVRTNTYYPGPDNGQVYFWLEGLTNHRLTGNATDFMSVMPDYNYDGVSYITVTADFGWPEVPPAIKQATVWITNAFAENPGPYIREDIADYGYSRGAPGFFDMSAIPSRAQDILDLYRRVSQ